MLPGQNPSAPLVSIILPTYNRASLLVRAIKSVLTQDYEVLELIVIDDGSTDNTLEVIQQISDPRIRTIRFDSNQGYGIAMHEGGSQVRGDLVAFIDSDDIWLPGKLSYQVRLFQTYPQIELHFADYLNINYVLSTKDSGFHQTERGLRRLKIMPLEAHVWEVIDGMPEAILESNFFATPTVMLRADAFQKVGNFNPLLRAATDFEYWWRAALKGVRFAYSTCTLMERHKDENSVTSKSIEFAYRYLEALTSCEKAARDAGRTDLALPLKIVRSRVWQNLIREYAVAGRRKEALTAFLACLPYGMSMHSAVNLAAAMAGPQLIRIVQQVRNQ